MATDALLAALKDADSDVREAAATALGRSGNADAAAALAECLTDPEPGVRVCAAVALSGLGWAAPTDEEQVLYETALGDLQIAVQAGESAAQALFEELNGGGPNQGGSDLTASDSEVQHSPALAELLQAAQQGESMSRLCAIYAIGQEQAEEATAVLINCLGDDDPAIRLAAAQMLERWGDPAHASQFVALLSDPHFQVRLLALAFVRRLNDPELAGVLAPLVGDPENDVRRAVAEALGVLGNQVAIEALVVAVVDEDPAVRTAATTALEQLDRRWAFSEPAQRAVPRLQQLLTDSRPRVSTGAAQLLAHLRGFDTSLTRRTAPGAAPTSRAS